MSPEPPFPRAKAPPAKRDRRLWGREWFKARFIVVPRVLWLFGQRVVARRDSEPVPGGRFQLVGSAIWMIRNIVTSLPVKRGILSIFENGADDFLASNDFFSSQAPDGVCFLAE